MTGQADVLADVMGSLSLGKDAAARATIKAEYPFVPRKRSKRTSTPRRTLTIAMRDGFIDRYTRQKLVYPAALAVITELLPKEFPSHPNGKMDVSHIAYWELFPSLDHITPIARGGTDTDENIVVTSMLKNSAKNNWTLEELGWELHEPGNLNEWDGLMKTTTELINRRNDLLKNKYIKKWHTAATKLLNNTDAIQ